MREGRNSTPVAVTSVEPATLRDRSAAPGHGGAGAAALALGSLGVVFGDIGTSPIYAFREALKRSAVDGTLHDAEILGVTSLILWAIILIVAIKYVLILLYADNKGEGGTLALMTLARRSVKRGGGALLVLGVVAAALFFGDALITPSISVLSAVEGLSLLTPVFDPYILPLTLMILVGLFAAQAFGTHRVAAAFGPIMLVWFGALGALGVMQIVDEPRVLAAFNPLHGVEFLLNHGLASIIALGAVFLAVTGAEALYADLGHFGRTPMKVAWFGLVMPSLMLNYLGQAALVLARPETASDPFFLMAPAPLLAPLVILATLATIIASQAVISGAYSLSRQAMQLGLLPRLEVRHTSDRHAGQIYMPQINFLLLVGCLFLVMMFKSSSALGAAYGIAVTGTMIITGILAFVVVRKVWGWRTLAAAALLGPFLALELVFFGANMLRFGEGGWFPLFFALCLFATMTTWMRGYGILAAKTKRTEVPLDKAIPTIETSTRAIVPGTAVFLTTNPGFAPTALMHNLKHNKVLHEDNVIMNVNFADSPRVAPADRVSVDRLSPRFRRIRLNFGFMESPDVMRALQSCSDAGAGLDLAQSSFFLSRRWLKPDPQSGMPKWQDVLFISLARNASTVTDFFAIPSDRVIEIGNQVTV